MKDEKLAWSSDAPTTWKCADVQNYKRGKKITEHPSKAGWECAPAFLKALQRVSVGHWRSKQLTSYTYRAKLFMKINDPHNLSMSYYWESCGQRQKALWCLLHPSHLKHPKAFHHCWLGIKENVTVSEAGIALQIHWYFENRAQRKDKAIICTIEPFV